MSVKCSEVVNYNICLGYFRLISQMFEEEIKYIRNYKVILNDYFKKVLNLQVNIGSKLGKPPDDFNNADWLNFGPVLKLTQQIPKMIQKQIENIKTFMDDLDKKTKTLDDFLKDKSNIIKRFQLKYDEQNNNLIKKYIDVEKIKISFFNSINKTEDIIGRYYDNKNKLDTAKKTSKSENELKILNDKNKEYESMKKSLISTTKKYEKEYNDIVNKSTKIEDKFLVTINDCINGIKDVSSDLSDKLNEINVLFFTSIKDSFQAPLDIINKNLSNSKNINEKENMDQIIINTFNNQSKLIHLLPEKYNLKSMDLNKTDENKNKEENYFNSKKCGFVRFEDGFEDMSYFEDDIAFDTVKEMLKNFELINYNGVDIDIEEEKKITKNYISKIIANMSNPKENNNIKAEEKNNLINLLNKHHNRIILLHKLNDYRALCQYEIKENDYNILGELFFLLINQSKSENDFHCIEMVIILSKTYFIIKDSKKIYLQNLIIDNSKFKTKEFWEELLLYSISKEVARSNKESDNKLKTKNENIIFSQLLSSIDNMFDFGLDENLIKEIIEPKITYYKISDNLKDTINDVIVSKIKAKNDKKNENNKNIER